MIGVTFGNASYTTTLLVMLPKTIQLREVQQALCSFFKQSFPKKLAKVKVYEKIYHDFEDYFLEDVIGEEIEVNVVFEDNNTDPYFYDVIDRRGVKCTIEDEIQWELETTRGDTCLTLAEWLRSKRALDVH